MRIGHGSAARFCALLRRIAQGRDVWRGFLSFCAHSKSAFGMHQWGASSSVYTISPAPCSVVTPLPFCHSERRHPPRVPFPTTSLVSVLFLSITTTLMCVCLHLCLLSFMRRPFPFSLETTHFFVCFPSSCTATQPHRLAVPLTKPAPVSRAWVPSSRAFFAIPAPSL